MESKEYNRLLALYQPHCNNRTLLRTLSRGANKYNSEKLVHELNRLGIPTEPEEVKAAEKKQDSEQLPASTEKKKEAPAPDGLAALEEELMALWKESSHLHQTGLGNQESQQQRRLNAFRILQIHQDLIPAIREKIEYLKEHGKLPEEVKPDLIEKLKPLSVAQLIQRRNSLRSYISKHKRKDSRKEDVERWEQELNAVATLLKDAEDSTKNHE